MQNVRAKLLDVVALLVDKPEKNLASGQVGTIVEELSADVFEVEFCDSEGCTISLAELKRSELLVLRYDAVLAA